MFQIFDYTIQASYIIDVRKNDIDPLRAGAQFNNFNISSAKELTIKEMTEIILSLYSVRYVSIKSFTLEMSKL